MTADQLIASMEALVTEHRRLKETVSAQKLDMATVYAWLCVLAERHGSASAGWANAEEGRTLTMTAEERTLWLKARESWLEETSAGYLSGSKDITLPHFP